MVTGFFGCEFVPLLCEPITEKSAGYADRYVFSIALSDSGLIGFVR